MDEDLPKIIFKQAVSLIELLDHYTAVKFTRTGNSINTPACFRQELLSFALAVACEIVNSGEKEFTEDDFEKAKQFIEEKLQYSKI